MDCDSKSRVSLFSINFIRRSSAGRAKKKRFIRFSLLAIPYNMFAAFWKSTIIPTLKLRDRSLSQG